MNVTLTDDLEDPVRVISREYLLDQVQTFGNHQSFTHPKQLTDIQGLKILEFPSS